MSWDREEAESKILQYSQLWQLYAEISVELKKKSELSQESAVAACKVYGPYMSDILQKVDKVMKIFAMEKELRRIKNRGHFLVPLITPQGNKIETSHDKDKVLEAVDEEITKMLNAMKQSEENYEREQERARIRDEQLRSARQTNRSDFNFATLANSTPIRSNNIRTDPPGVHFNTIQFATSIPQPVQPAETTDMSHQQMTQSSKEQVLPRQANSQLTQPIQEIIMTYGD